MRLIAGFSLLLISSALMAEECQTVGRSHVDAKKYEVHALGVQGVTRISGRAEADGNMAAQYGEYVTVEEGKELQILYRGGLVRLKKNIDQKIEYAMGYKIDGRDNLLPMKTNTWFPDGGDINSVAATMVVPATSNGRMEIWFQAKEENGNVLYDSNHANNFPVHVIPKTAPRKTICFDKDWHEIQSAPIRNADVIRVDYDWSRLLRNIEGATYNGIPIYELTAYARFRDRDGNAIEYAEYPLLFRKYDPPTGKYGSERFAPLIYVPRDATQVSFWFKAQGRGRPNFDSDYGKDYPFVIDSSPR